MCMTYILVALFMCGASVVSAQLRIAHSYPLGGNFSYVTLTCLDGALPVQGAEFQLNATDIEAVIHDVSHDGNGTISFALTQDQEGKFTCSRSGTVSNGIALAAQPNTVEYQSKKHSVYLPSADSEVPTELQCDIQPGALAQRYSVQWRRRSQNGNYIDVYAELFNITLNVNSGLNGSQYQCEVTINHDGSLNRTYYSGVVTLLVEARNSGSKFEEAFILGLGIIIIICLIATATFFICGIGYVAIEAKKKRREPYHPIYMYVRLEESERLECLRLSTFRSSVVHREEYASTDFSNTSTHAVPPFVKPTATLHQCTSVERTYYDKVNDLTLKIPEGAIPEGESLTIDIGVALYGPFQYPEGLRPVSPVLWICVQDRKHNMHFRKPVSITLQHCLIVESEEEIESLGLTFLKGDHEMNPEGKYQFHRVEDSLFKAKTDYGTLQTHHFCYQCIVCNISEFTIQRTKFCLCGTIPRTLVYDKRMYVVFFVTFLLEACLETVRRQILNMPEIAEYEYHLLKKEFQFRNSPTPAIRIEIPKDLPGGWQLGQQLQNEISLNEIDFLQISQEELKLKEKEGMYPPHFHVIIDGTNTTQKAQAQIHFTGTTRDDSLVCDIPLVPPPQGFTLPLPQQSSMTCAKPLTSATPTTPVTLKNLLNFVAAKIPRKWMDFGIQLDIPYEELETYPRHDCKECFNKVFSTWKRNGSPPYTWETVIDVLESPSVNEKELAQSIRKLL